MEDCSAVEYRAPFILPWVVTGHDGAPGQQQAQAQSFVPFTTGSDGVCCCVPGLQRRHPLCQRA